MAISWRHHCTTGGPEQCHHQDQHNITKIFKFDEMSLISSCSRVTSGERAESGCKVTFVILRKRLSLFKDDCVKLRVTKVFV